MGQRTNTFEKGMNKDFNPIFQPDSTYTNLVNCNIVSQDGNNFAIKDCMGNTLVFTLNRRYSTNISSFDALPTAVGFISFPNKLVVLSTNDETEGGGYGEIGVINYLPYGEGIQPLAVTGQSHSGYTPLYNSVDLKFSKLHRIEGFGLQENNLIERIYFSDNNTEPKVLNVADPIFSTYIASGSLSAVAGTKYMVIEGAVEYPVGSGKFYGPTSFPGSILFPGGNILITDGTHTTYTASTGTSPIPKIIEYIPTSLLSWTPSRTLGGIEFKNFGSGNVFCGSKIYFYRLGLKSNYKTSWSYASSNVAVGIPLDPNQTNSGNAYHNYAGAGTTTVLQNSFKSVRMTVDNIDTSFDIIELACAEYDQLNDVFRQITIVDLEVITGSTMVLEHNGNKNLGILTLNDVTLFPSTIIKLKTLTTEKNYNIIGNISERQELDVNITGITMDSFQYPMNTFYNPYTCSNTVIYDDVSPTSGVNPGTSAIPPSSRWLVSGTGTVTYNGNNYVAGDVFVGVPSVNTYTTTGSPVIRPCVTKNRYTPVLGGVGTRRENAIELLDPVCFWDYKSAMVQEHCTGYWSDEKYRFGILFYDLKGNPYYVRWIGDYTFPTATTKGNLIIKQTYSSQDMYSINPSGVKFSNIQIPKEIVGQISGFSIVRAPRDARIITQGLVVQTTTAAGTPNTFRPISYVIGTFDARQPAIGAYSYICPDNLVDSPLKGRYGQIGDTLESAAWLDALPYPNTSYARAYGGGEQIVSKLVVPLVGDSAKRIKKITYFGSANENELIFDGVENFSNSTLVGNNGTAPDADCSGGTPFSVDNFQNVGGKKNFVKLESDFNFYLTSSFGYSENTTGGGYVSGIKVLMNYCIENLNQYGGTSETALANTTYISTGHFQPITAGVISETCNTSDPNNYDYLLFNNVEVFGGDCFVNFVDYGYGLWNYDGGSTPSFSYGWTFPCEGNANYNLRRGKKVTTVEMYHTAGTLPATSNSLVFEGPTGEVRLEGYSYNKGYSTEGQSFQYPALPVNFISANVFPTRIRYAGPKFLGEITDSFRTFLINDRFDMPVNYGEITNIKVKDGRVIVWQQLATNTVPILERQLLSANDGSVTTIGTGGVINRNDPLTSFFGNQHQWSLIETEYGFAWFDMRRKAYVILGFDGTGLIEESQIGGLNGFFNEVFLEVIGENSSINNDILNDPSFSVTSDRPLIGVGITGVYDPKFKMTYMTFKFMARKRLNSDVIQFHKDFTIGYLHNDKVRAFIGFYDWLPAITHNHNQIVISANNPKNTTQYLPEDGDYAGYSFFAGETLELNEIEYISIQDVTLNSAEKYPGYPNSIYWAVINDQSQLWVHNQPKLLGQSPAPDYLYNSFFGRVVDNKLEIVVNPKTQNPFVVTNIEQLDDTGVNYTSVFTNTATQSAADVNISITNRNYRKIFNKIVSSLPLNSVTGRLIDSFLKITFVKKNWTSDPTVGDKPFKLLQYINSLFSEKR